MAYADTNGCPHLMKQLKWPQAIIQCNTYLMEQAMHS
jgi:hypothetical protein